MTDDTLEAKLKYSRKVMLQRKRKPQKPKTGNETKKKGKPNA